MAFTTITLNINRCLKINTSRILCGVMPANHVHGPVTRNVMMCQSYSNHAVTTPCNFTVTTDPSYFQKRFYNRKKTRKMLPTTVLNFDYGGDQIYESYPIELSDTKVSLEGAAKLEQVDELTRRLLSLEYSDGQEKHKRRIYDLVSKVKEHPLDLQSIEVIIAFQTVAIRNSIRHVETFRKDKAAKSMLVERIQSRRKHMKILRTRDYEKFMWLCTQLQIKYIPVPEYNKKPSKASVIKRAAREEAFTAMRTKMEAFREKLAEDREEFEEYKGKELERIQMEIQDLGLDESSKIVKVFQTLKDGDILKLDGKTMPLKRRRNAILEHKFKLAEVINKEREAQYQASLK